MMNVNLEGKLALVCASTKGLGFSCAMNLAKSGCDIILTGRSKENLEIASAKIISASKDISFEISVNCIQVDLEDRKTFARFEKQLSNYPDIDILILNSGGPSPGDFATFNKPEDFEEKCSKITYPAIRLLKYVLPKMRENGWGRIINISSIGLVKPITGLAVSNASRSYLAGLMVGVGNENARFGITINTVLPGIIWTDRQKMLAEHDAQSQGVSFEEIIAQKSALVPSQKMGDPDDVGKLVTFLSSPHAGYVNGQFISVDGGMLGLIR